MDAKGILNQGLRLLGSYSVNSIAPAGTPLERHCAEGYPQWRDSELIRRRWVFNRATVTLTVTGSAPDATAMHPYAFDLPSDCLAPVRQKGDTWVQKRGRKIYHSDTTLDFEYKARVVETDFDTLFNDTLACRIAFEMCEWVTQSNVKKSDALELYRKSIAVAAANNALIIGAEDSVHETEGQDEWLNARYGYGL
jgi:hypothetical protein